jgi:hypothetical protein
MNLTKILTVAIISVLFAGCGTIKELKNQEMSMEFDRIAREYSRMVRWHELDSAQSTYVSTKLWDEYRKRITAAAGINIVDYRVKSMECTAEKREGSAVVEFDYYRLPSVTVHTVEDRQKWSYEGEEGSRDWLLTTLLPDFK